MAVPKAKLLALFAVAMMVVSMTCIVYAGEDSNADSSASIELGTNNRDKSYFTGLGATCDDASYTYSSGTGTLRIKNFTFVTGAEKAAIEVGDAINLVIVVEGNNTISSTTESGSICITCKANIVISGDTGSRLTVTAGDANGDSYGINGKDLTIKGGLKLDITSGDTEDDVSCGIATNSLSIEGSTVSVSSGGARGASGSSYGIIAKGSVSINNSDVSITSGEAKGTSGSSNGILATGSVSINNSDVSITSGDASYESYGIMTDDGTLTIKDSTVSVTSGDAYDEGAHSFGIGVNTLTVTGANTIVKSKAGEADNPFGASASVVTITGATAEFEGSTSSAGMSLGLMCGQVIADHANIKATGGTVEGGDEDAGSCGIWICPGEESGNSSFTDSVITAAGGEAMGTGSHSVGIILSLKSSLTTGFTSSSTMSFTRCVFLSIIGYDFAFSTNGGSFAIDDYQSLQGSSTIENPSFEAVNASNLTTFKYIRSVIPEPLLEITSPIDGSTVSGSTIKITGITNCSSVTITVNGTDVGDVEVIDGSFSKTVTLSEGKNTITVTVTNILGQTLTEEIEVTYGQSSDTSPALTITVAIAILAVAGIALYPGKD